MKFKYLIVASLLLAACGGSDSDDDDDDNTAALMSREVLEGTWASVDHDTDCETAITFDLDGSFRATSLDEVTSGTYTFEEVNLGFRFDLTLDTKVDNGLSNCDGISALELGLEVFDAQRVGSNSLVTYDESGSVEDTFGKTTTD